MNKGDKMNIYIFYSRAGSFNDGQYFFAAKELEDAEDMAREFQKKHNDRTCQLAAYQISFRKVPKIFKVKPGFLPLNRSGRI